MRIAMKAVRLGGVAAEEDGALDGLPRDVWAHSGVFKDDCSMRRIADTHAY